MTQLNILFGNDVHLTFRLRDTSIAKRWAEQLQLAQDLGYTIDDPKRFYDCNNQAVDEEHALCLINKAIDTINSYQLIINRQLTDVNDQDTLNYLHHIFEVYHGLLDTQSSNPFFISAPTDVQHALADLNIHVHRCESIGRSIASCGQRPRAVVTYYGLPKTQQFELLDYLHFTNIYKFGTVYINYVEIGKSLKSLAKDDDQYIADEAFRPYKYFSADFNVKFYSTSLNDVQKGIDVVDTFYNKNKEWFTSRGYHRYSPMLATGQLPVADLDTTMSSASILGAVQQNQIISRVWLE